MSKKNKHQGTSLEDFLEEEGLLEEIDESVDKKIFVFLLEKEMKALKMDKTRLAQKMSTSYSQVKRILDPKQSCSLSSLKRAAKAVNKNLILTLG